MKHALTIFFLLVIPCAAQPRVELSVDPAAKEIWAGQEVAVHVDLLVPGYFSGVPFFSLPEVPGVLLVPPVGSPTVSSKEIDGVSYTVQRHDIELVPSRGGEVKLPPFEIRLSYKAQPLDKVPVDQTVKTSAVSLTVKQPPGTGPDDAVITSEDVTVTEEWRPEPGNKAKAGDAFVRLVHWEASDVPTMAFPPFQPGKIAGMGIYQDSPSITEVSDRGSMRSVRVDRVTYVCKTGGNFVIPAVSFQWWDAEKQELRHVDFPERKIHVPAPPVPPETATEKATRLWQRYGAAFLTSLGTLAALAVFVRLTRAWWRSIFQRLRPRHLASLNP